MHRAVITLEAARNRIQKLHGFCRIGETARGGQWLAIVGRNGVTADGAEVARPSSFNLNAFVI
jgi:hypothetical protein